MAINIGKRMEVFWDDHIIDTEKTTAFHRVLNPVKKGECFVFDGGWEKDYTCGYPCIVKDGKNYKMYYDYQNYEEMYHPKQALAILESNDGIHWTRPDLNIYPHPELEGRNNIVLEPIGDGYYVFVDENPACPPEEKYKAVGAVWRYNEEKGKDEPKLYCFASPDGYHFKEICTLREDSLFDSMNIIFWRNNRYECYFRNFHQATTREGVVRDVRVMYSDDFKTWTGGDIIRFSDEEVDTELYTNNIIPYERAPHILIGFPARYVEKPVWTSNMERMKGGAAKNSLADNYGKERCRRAATDCLFMCSRDGKNWTRYVEPFLTPGLETETNWLYGDNFLAYNMIEKDENTWYFYDIDNHGLFGKEKILTYYEIIKDRFACAMAENDEKVVVTKPLVFEGKDLHLNFSTSVYGHIFVEVLDKDGNPYPDAKSFEIFGDTVDRKTDLENGSDFSAFSGKEIRLKFTLKQSKLFSMWFE